MSLSLWHVFVLDLLEEVSALDECRDPLRIKQSE